MLSDYLCQAAEAAGVTKVMISHTTAAQADSQVPVLAYLSYCFLRLYQEQIKSGSPFLPGFNNMSDLPI